LLSLFSRMRLCPPPAPTPFPYTTLFRSAGLLPRDRDRGVGVASAVVGPVVVLPCHQLDQAVRAANHPGRPVDQELRDARPLEVRSEEHTSELQSRENLVCRLLLEKKNSL